MISPVGYFKMHRELFSKPIWVNSNSKQKAILITLLAMAQWKDNKWEFGNELYETKSGQFITSLESIAIASGKDISIQNVRTTLKRLETLGFLTNKSTNKNRLITLVNWGKYQEDTVNINRQDNKQLTSNQQATNKQLTTKEEYKKVRKKECKNITMEILLYGSLKNVKLTKEEYDKLKQTYPALADEAIEFLSLYLEEKGDKSKAKTHNATIRRWVIAAVEERRERQNRYKGTPKKNVGNFEQRSYEEDYYESMIEKA